VTYEPDPSDYPFDLIAVDVLVGAQESAKVFQLRIFSVDANNAPSTRLADADVVLQGSSSAFNQIYIPDLELDLPAFESGNFAVALCQMNHNNEPSVARDGDGMSAANRNHIFAEGMWWQSSFFGVSGDWIQRAYIRTR